MPLFKYKAADEKSGKTLEVIIEGESQSDSLHRLRQRNFLPIRYIGKVDGEHRSSFRFFSWGKRDFDVYEFTNRLVPLLKAQITLEKALGIIAESMDNEKTKSIVIDIRRGLHEGKKFSSLIRDRGNYFPSIYANMVEAGEESGALPNVMEELQRFLNERRQLKEFLITSSIYPIIILTVTSAVLVLLFTVFIPKFSKIFLSMGKTLPVPTQIMMWISGAITGLWWLWLILIAGLCFFIREIKKGGKAKVWWDETVLKIPVFGKLVQVIEVTRFIRTLSVLIKNHVHLLDTVNIAERMFQNTRIKNTLSDISAELRGGGKLSAALGKSEYVPKTVIQMLNIGEETGNMGGMLEQVAEYYEDNVRNRIKRLLALFEPVVILLLAVIVLGVVSSIFLAITGISNLGQ